MLSHIGFRRQGAGIQASHIKDGDMPELMVFAIVGAVVFYQLYVSAILFRADEYDTPQRWLQVWMVWLLPLIGALGCHLFLLSQRAPGPRPDSRFVPQEPTGGLDGNMD